ncbi:hypothetical protein F0562_000779 [Nyssa sinensis]|uniref:Uncharacterized protein n=1 Tax=Nyssa sinensis TaxID=561372 RepID=A0A5J5C115_9ASTE|nr:hypothetical protein F0562_000779 [Nyssa sinensis]
MGNYISCRTLEATGKVILLDGTVHEYDKSLTAAELMLEYPQQVVVEFQSAVTSKRPTPLPADKKLDMDKLYLMLPMKRGKPAALSSEEARRLLLRANSVLKTRFLQSSSGFIPLFARICSAGTGGGQMLVLRRKDKLVESVEEERKPEFMTEILEGRPEYLSMQFSGKGWKPSLDTIKEKENGDKKKVPHWFVQSMKEDVVEDFDNVILEK